MLFLLSWIARMSPFFSPQTEIWMLSFATDFSFTVSKQNMWGDKLCWNTPSQEDKIGLNVSDIFSFFPTFRGRAGEGAGFNGYWCVVFQLQLKLFPVVLWSMQYVRVWQCSFLISVSNSLNVWILKVALENLVLKWQWRTSLNVSYHPCTWTLTYCYSIADTTPDVLALMVMMFVFGFCFFWVGG